MPVQIEWDNPTMRLLKISLEQNWTWDEFYHIEVQTRQFLNTVYHPVSYVVDFSRASMMPRGIDLGRVQHVLAFEYPQSDMVFVVGVNACVNTMLKAVISAMKRAGKPIIPVNSIADARLMVEKRPALRESRHAAHTGN